MSELSYYKCITATDVWNQAQRQRDLRKDWFTPREEPKRMIPIPFEKLVAAAYPEKYPEQFPDTDQPPSLSAILEAVCRSFRCRRSELASPLKHKYIIIPRHVYVALARRLTTRSTPEIGREIGGRDHTTILHAIRKMRHIIAAAESDLDGTATLEHWVEACKRYTPGESYAQIKAKE